MKLGNIFNYIFYFHVCVYASMHTCGYIYIHTYACMYACGRQRLMKRAISITLHPKLGNRLVWKARMLRRTPDWNYRWATMLTQHAFKWFLESDLWSSCLLSKNHWVIHFSSSNFYTLERVRTGKEDSRSAIRMRKEVNSPQSQSPLDKKINMELKLADA